MLIGVDDISNDVTAISACFHVFFNVCLHSRSFPQRRSCKLSFLFPPAARAPRRACSQASPMNLYFNGLSTWHETPTTPMAQWQSIWTNNQSVIGHTLVGSIWGFFRIACVTDRRDIISQCWMLLDAVESGLNIWARSNRFTWCWNDMLDPCETCPIPYNTNHQTKDFYTYNNVERRLTCCSLLQWFSRDKIKGNSDASKAYS